MTPTTAHGAPQEPPEGRSAGTGDPQAVPGAQGGARAIGPKRIQRHRAKGWRAPEGAVYVGRGTRWGNPWRVEDGMSARGAVWRYRDAALGHLPFAKVPSVDEIRAELAGRDLMCWCPPDQPCHADVLLELANPYREGESS